jgi:hypothetical protein
MHYAFRLKSQISMAPLRLLVIFHNVQGRLSEKKRTLLDVAASKTLSIHAHSILIIGF